MKSEWTTATLEQVCRLITDGAHNSPKSVENGEYMASVKDFTEFGLDFSKCKRISEDDYILLKKQGCVPEIDDILVGKDGARFFEDIIIYRQQEHPVLLSSIAILRPDQRTITSDFLYYTLRSPLVRQNVRENYGSGSAIPRIVLKDFKRMPISFPSLDEQRKITSICEILDKKIQLNDEINKNLFEQVRALYKDRFIDLMPFGGSMPSDWHLGTVSEIIELHDSKRIPLSSRERAELDKIYPYYGATSVMDYVDRYLFDGIYLLLGEDGTVVDGQGFPILQYVEGKFWVNNHAHIITGKNGFTVELLYLLFSLTNVQSIVTGAVQPKISQANLNKVPIVIPSEAELKAFDESIQPFFAEIRNLRAENDRLATVRDSMLPRLMSGELDVSDLDF